MNYVSKMIFPENRGGFPAKRIPHKILETFLVEKNAKKNEFLGICLVISIKWVNEMVQNHAYSQAKLSEVILEVLRRLMGSSLFQDRAPRESDFLVNPIIS